jgi:hypothetical protein
MRFLGFLLFVLGLVLMLAPSAITSRIVDREIARAAIYENGAFQPFDIELGPAQAPVAIIIRLEEGGAYEVGDGTAALALVASSAGRSVFAQAVTFDNADWIEPASDPASTETVIYEKRIGRIAELAGGSYRFEASEGDAEPISLQRVELVLRANAFAVPDVSNFAIAMVWVGVILWVIGQRRRARKLVANPPPPPPAPKWGKQ